MMKLASTMRVFKNHKQRGRSPIPKGHQGKLKEPNANTNKKSKPKKTPIANKVLIA